jgi:hypothetical protein
MLQLKKILESEMLKEDIMKNKQQFLQKYILARASVVSSISIKGVIADAKYAYETIQTECNNEVTANQC